MRSRLLKALFGAAGLAFLVISFLESWDRSQGLPLVAWPRLLLAAVAVFASLQAGLRAWAALLEVPPAGLATGFLTSQLGKYVPGGVWQAVGQVGYAASDVVTVRRASVGFVTFAVTQAVSGACVGALFALAPGPVPGWVRLAAAGGVLAVIVLRRGWLVRVAGWAARMRGIEQVGDELVPRQGAIVRSTCWGAVSMVSVGTGFAAVLPADVEAAGWATVGLAFVVAWTVGFLAIPVPAGVGVREAVLLVTLGGLADTSVLVAASVALRLVAMASEAVAVGASRLRTAVVATRSRDVGTSDEPPAG